EDASAHLSAVLDGGGGELVHQPLSTETLSHDEAGDRPHALEVGVLAHPRLLTGPDPRVVLPRFDRDPPSGLAVDIPDQARRGAARTAAGLLQQRSVALLLGRVAPNPARDLEGLTAALAGAASLEHRLDLFARHLVGRSPTELGHTARLAAAPAPVATPGQSI